MPALDKAIYKLLFECLKLKSRDSFLILVDKTTYDLGKLFFNRANYSKIDSAIVEIKPLDHRSPELPSSIINMMKQMAVVLSMTGFSFIHSNALKNICHNGARVLCFNQIDLEAFTRFVNTDFEFIVRKSQRLADLFSIGKRIHVTTEAGTDLIIPIARHRGIANTGIVAEPGAFCTLPSGEARITPDRRGTKGLLVVDASIPAIGMVQEPIAINIQEGYAYQITGGKDVTALRKILKPFGKQSRNIAEFGIGTNPHAIVTGNSIEDEKVLETAHIAFGSPDFEGGSYKKTLHLDLIFQKPTISIDGHPIVAKGKLLV